MITSRPWLGIIGTNPMDRKAEEASEVQRKSAVILSDRSREIIRLFEELERKRHQVSDSLAATPFRQTAKAEIDCEPEAPALLKLTGYFPAPKSIRRRLSSSGVQNFPRNAATSPSPSPALNRYSEKRGALSDVRRAPME